MAKTFSKEDVASHGKDNTPWIIIDEDVYDVSKFQDEHPGKFSQLHIERKILVASAESHADDDGKQVERRVRHNIQSPRRTPRKKTE